MPFSFPLLITQLYNEAKVRGSWGEAACANVDSQTSLEDSSSGNGVGRGWDCAIAKER